MKIFEIYSSLVPFGSWCGMRRPSTEQTKDDLNRLTASASVRSSESVNSTQTAIKAIANNNHNSHSNDSNNNKNNNNSSSNYLPNIIIASAELQQQCRKRKDRQDSTSSITQDRKVVRSSSEENVPGVCQEQSAGGDALRRVSSHDNFNGEQPKPDKRAQAGDDVSTQHSSCECRVVVSGEIENQSSGDSTGAQNNSMIDVSTPSAAQDITDFLDENERRRESERFLKTKSPSGRKSPRRSRKTSPVVFKERDENAKDGEEVKGDREAEEMPKAKPLYPWESAEEEKPVVCQRFAENTFDHVHHSISKFIKHDHDLVKFNYAVDEEDDKKHYRSNFMSIESVKAREILHQKSHSPLSSGGVYQTPDERIRQINKRLASLKKKIGHYEESFETSYGYRPSHADKSSDKNIKNYIAEIHKLRKEKSQIKTDPIAAMGYKNKFDDSMPIEKKLGKLRESLHDIEKKLQEKRVEEERPAQIEEMSPDQLVEEKSSIQRALLYFESMFGRPGTPDERDAARPLYDRYRLLKRLVNRNNSISSIIPELPTILENEALALSGSGIVTPSTDFSPPSAHSAIQSPSDSSTSTSIDAGLLTGHAVTTAFQENFQLHSMSVKELHGHFDTVREEKKQLRRTIKEFEHNFEELNGRKMLKSDRTLIDDTYTLYKEKKAKLRLLDALVKKQMSV